MQWMTMTSFVPCHALHALHAPQHAAASPFGPLNHSNDFFRPLHNWNRQIQVCRFLFGVANS